jgi:hypothetical protein
MHRFIVAILVAAAAICSSAHDVVLAQTATTPNVVPPFVGLSTPVTSTVTNCMMSCLQFAVRELSNHVLHSKRAGAAPKHSSAGVGGGRFAHSQFSPKHDV